MKEKTIECSNILDLPGGDSFCCMLEAGHSGPHRDEFQHDGRTVVIVWHSEPFRVAIAKEE